METISEIESGRVVCPSSLRGLDETPLSETWQLHYVSPEELKANGGVCAACASKIRKHNVGFLNGTETKQEPLEPQHVRKFVPDDHTGYAAEDGIVPTEDFDFASVEQALDEFEQSPDDAQAIAATTLARLFSFVWCDKSLRASLIRFSALFAGLRPDLVERTYQEIGQECGGVTKQAVSKAALNAQSFLKIKFRRSRSDEARKHMAAAMLENKKRSNISEITPETGVAA